MSEPKKIIVTNWKMQLNLAASCKLAKQIASYDSNNVELVICPSFTSLSAVGDILRDSQLVLGAQDVFWQAKGAFTGEISPEQLTELGCRYVLIGHSERRTNLGETDEMVNRKISAALAAGLTPILCVGETLQQRQAGEQDNALAQQVTRALVGINLSVNQHLIIAYEPVWVIGSGQAIQPAQAQLAHQVIRQTLNNILETGLVNNIRIIYGGSVDSSNVKEFISLVDTAGVLVGSASLDVAEFAAIINSI